MIVPKVGQGVRGGADVHCPSDFSHDGASRLANSLELSSVRKSLPIPRGAGDPLPSWLFPHVPAEIWGGGGRQGGHFLLGRPVSVSSLRVGDFPPEPMIRLFQERLLYQSSGE